MAKVIFNSFQEASAFAKKLAMFSKSASKINKDGETWWVDDPSIQPSQSDFTDNDIDEKSPRESISNNTGTSGSYLISKELDQDSVNGINIDNNCVDNVFYDNEGYNSEGNNRQGFNRENIHKDTHTEYDPSGFNIFGFDLEGYDKDGYDKNEIDREGFHKYPF